MWPLEGTWVMGLRANYYCPIRGDGHIIKYVSSERALLRMNRAIVRFLNRHKLIFVSLDTYIVDCEDIPF